MTGYFEFDRRPIKRRERKRLRKMVRDYARRSLGVDHLPAGVPKLLDHYVDSLTNWPGSQDRTLIHILEPYRRRTLLP